MTTTQFKQLMDKLDKIIVLLEAQQGEEVKSTTFEWIRDTVVPPYQFEGGTVGTAPFGIYGA